jgi:hypothetical protein
MILLLTTCLAERLFYSCFAFALADSSKQCKDADNAPHGLSSTTPHRAEASGPSAAAAAAADTQPAVLSQPDEEEAGQVAMQLSQPTTDISRDVAGFTTGRSAVAIDKLTTEELAAAPAAMDEAVFEPLPPWPNGTRVVGPFCLMPQMSWQQVLEADLVAEASCVKVRSACEGREMDDEPAMPVQEMLQRTAAAAASDNEEDHQGTGDTAAETDQAAAAPHSSTATAAVVAAAEQAKEVAAATADVAPSPQVVAAGCGQAGGSADPVQGDDHPLFTLSAAASVAAEELDLTVEGLLVAEAVQEALIAEAASAAATKAAERAHVAAAAIEQTVAVRGSSLSAIGLDITTVVADDKHESASCHHTNSTVQVPDAASSGPVADRQAEHLWSAQAAEALATEAKSAEAAAAMAAMRQELFAVGEPLAAAAAAAAADAVCTDEAGAQHDWYGHDASQLAAEAKAAEAAAAMAAIRRELLAVGEPLAAAAAATSGSLGAAATSRQPEGTATAAAEDVCTTAAAPAVTAHITESQQLVMVMEDQIKEAKAAEAAYNAARAERSRKARLAIARRNYELIQEALAAERAAAAADAAAAAAMAAARAADEDAGNAAERFKDLLCSGLHAASPNAAQSSAADSSGGTTASADGIFVPASPATVSWLLSHDLAAAEIQLTQLAAASCHPAILAASGADNRQALGTSADEKVPSSGNTDGAVAEGGATSDSSTGSQLLADAIATQQMQAAGAIAVQQAHQRVVTIYRARRQAAVGSQNGSAGSTSTTTTVITTSSSDSRAGHRPASPLGKAAAAMASAQLGVSDLALALALAALDDEAAAAAVAAEQLLQSDSTPEASRQQAVNQEPDAQSDEEDFGRYIKVVRQLQVEASTGGPQQKMQEGLSEAAPVAGLDEPAEADDAIAAAAGGFDVPVTLEVPASSNPYSAVSEVLMATTAPQPLDGPDKGDSATSRDSFDVVVQVVEGPDGQAARDDQPTAAGARDQGVPATTPPTISGHIAMAGKLLQRAMEQQEESVAQLSAVEKGTATLGQLLTAAPAGTADQVVTVQQQEQPAQGAAAPTDPTRLPAAAAEVATTEDVLVAIEGMVDGEVVSGSSKALGGSGTNSKLPSSAGSFARLVEQLGMAEDGVQDDAVAGLLAAAASRLDQEVAAAGASVVDIPVGPGGTTGPADESTNVSSSGSWTALSEALTSLENDMEAELAGLLGSAAARLDQESSAAFATPAVPPVAELSKPAEAATDVSPGAASSEQDSKEGMHNITS